MEELWWMLPIWFYWISEWYFDNEEDNEPSIVQKNLDDFRCSCCGK